MQIEVLRLAPGDDLRLALERGYAALALAHGVQAGCVVSAVGSLQGAVLRMAAQEAGTAVDGPLELLTLAGTFSAQGPHLHASVSRADGSVLGGHLLAGCTVRTTAEVVLALLPGWQFTRAMDAATGYAELMAQRVGPAGDYDGWVQARVQASRDDPRPALTDDEWQAVRAAKRVGN